MRLVRRIVFIGFCLVVAGNVSAALNVTPSNSATQLWNCLFPKPLPSGVTINSVTYIGSSVASGCYSNMPAINGIQPNDGLLMTSGQATLAIGPNNATGSGLSNGTPGDAALTTLIGGVQTLDAAVLTISFTIDTSVHGISFDFVFGSEEYPEYVGSFNDVFAAFLDGTNISLDSTGKFISVNNNFFKVDNQDKHIDLQNDGFTPLLRSSASLSAGTHTLKFAIADAKDQVLDSDVFLSNFQFSCSDTGTHPVSEVILLTPEADTNFVGAIDTLTANVKNIAGVPVVGRKVIFEILKGPHAGKKDSSITNSSGNALFIYTGTTVGKDTIVATMKDNFGSLVSSDNVHHVWKLTPSQSPIADAGPDRTFFANAACDALVSLDGSGSTDPDGGTIVSYSWKGAFSGSPVTTPSKTTSITLQTGIYEIILTVTNNAGKTDVDTTIITVIDNTPPAIPTLSPLHGECTVTAVPPTTTDNCAGIITGTTNDSLTYSTPGSRTIHWKFTDNAGNYSNQTQTVEIADVTKPVPDVIPLPKLTGECSYTITTYPTATDNCSNVKITGVPSATSFTTQGDHVVTWTYTDVAGNSVTQTQTVSIADVTKPVPDKTTLPTLSGECSYTITTYPTATDNCSAAKITGVPSATNFTTKGDHVVTWTYTDAVGNTATQTQTVTIADVTMPVPDKPTLPTLSGECSYTITTYPTATDNCSTTKITGVPSATNFTTKGNNILTWTYTDSAGNSTTQTQIVVIADVTKPVPDEPTLPTLTAECSYTITTYPTATDNCSAGKIKGVPSATSFTTQGDHIVTWTYTDAAGNSTTQTQIVSIADLLKPVPDQASLPTLAAECSYAITAYPTATDNCSNVKITGVPSATSFTTQGEHVITWTYTDAAGNSITQLQTVKIQDVKSPVLSVSADTTVYLSAKKSSAIILLKPATATDNCMSAPVVTAYRSDGKPLDSAYQAGVTTIKWKTFDNVNNGDSAEQKITVVINKEPVLAAVKDTIINETDSLGIHLTAVDPDGSIPVIFGTGLPAGSTVFDSANGSGLFRWKTGCNDHGIYPVIVHATDGVDSVHQQFNITVRDINFPPRFFPINDTSALENQPFTLTVRSEDCDAGVPLMKLFSIPLGATFKDNGDGTGTFSWIPKCDQNGFYMLIFEVTDGVNTIRDTMVLVITDVNCYDPEITLSEKNVSTGVNLPVNVAIHVSDKDKTVPKLKVQDLPDGALFTVDGNGNAILKWIPDKVGIFTPKIIAVDGADTTVQVDTTITISVVEHNFSKPAFIPCNDTTINENQQLILTLSAKDPDGTIPVIKAITLPDGATLTDNSDGNAKVSWLPGCTSHGKHLVVARTTDGTFSDTISVLVTVRDQNCPPIINPVHNKNVALNSTLRFTVSATDPDEDGTAIILSAESNMPGYTFTTDGNGKGAIIWTATVIGNFNAIFYANDGFLTDTETVAISVNQSGSLTITAAPKGTAIYVDPSTNASGMLLGTDSTTWTGGVGTWWFRAEAPGYRPTIFTGTVKANSTSAITVALKPTIPLMFTPPKEIKVGSGNAFGNGASIAFVDYDNDGIQDLSVADGKTIKIYLGNDSVSGLTYVSPGISITTPSNFDSVLSHTYCNWNNEGKYECIVSFASGSVVVAELDNEELSAGHELLSRPGEKLYPTIIDFNKDNRKDLLVLSGGKGLFVYLNKDTDKYPALDSVLSIADSTASTVSSGNPLIWDVDGNGWNDIIAMSGENMKLFSTSGDSMVHYLAKKEDVNAGGQRIKNEITSATLLILPHNLPVLAVVNKGKILAYRMRLSGDVSGDGVVNISDISKISKAWELTDEHTDWNPLFNLRLSAPGEHEMIDIKDISKAAKSWELQE